MNSACCIDINKIKCLDCNNVFYEVAQDELNNCPYCGVEISYMGANYRVEDRSSINLEVDFKTGKIVR